MGRYACSVAPATRPTARDAGVSLRMSRQRRTGTTPELAVRRSLHRRGFRYRVDAPLPGLPRRRADLLFGGVKVAVFIDGCFWHSCPEHATVARSNSEWWAAKLSGNVDRDRATDRHLTQLGWTVLRFWEHENPSDVVDQIANTLTVLKARRPSSPVRHSPAKRDER